eukprot:7715368-Pyramimonas_sp.AAC.1
MAMWPPERSLVLSRVLSNQARLRVDFVRRAISNVWWPQRRSAYMPRTKAFSSWARNDGG